ncbi:protein of unknown function [Nitratireductor aquimarinus]
MARQEDEFRIGCLPQKEIRQALLAACADDEIGIGNTGGIETGSETIDIDVVGGDLSRLHIGKERFGGAHDLVTRTVIEGDHQIHAGIFRRQVFRFKQKGLDVLFEVFAVANDANANPVLMQFREIAPDEQAQEAHEVVHLGARSGPVFGGEGVNGQPVDAQLTGRAHRFAQRLHTGAVAGTAWQAARFRPATVAVHDDRHMRRLHVSASPRVRAALGLVEHRTETGIRFSIVPMLHRWSGSSFHASGWTQGDLDVHDLGFFLGQELVHDGDGLIRHLLHLFGLRVQLVLAYVAILFGLFEMLHAVAAHVARGNLGALGVLMGDLHEFLAPLFIELWQRNAQGRTVHDRVEPEIRFADRAVHGIDHALVPHRHGDHAGFGHGHRGHLVDRHGCAISLHLDRVQKVGRSTARTKRSKIVLKRTDCPFHTSLQIFEINAVGHS